MSAAATSCRLEITPEMRRFWSLVVLSSVCLAAQSAAEASRQDEHLAACVAVLKADSERLAALVKLGNHQLRPTLLETLEQGATLIGLAYLAHPQQEDAAKAQMHEAETQLGRKTAEERRSLQLACSSEARQAFDETGIVSRAVVKRLAAARMARLLQP